MKNYTAIYSTETIKNIEYAFKAENMEAAELFCQNKFSVPLSEIEINEDFVYVIAWESGRGVRYADGSETGCELISSAIEFFKKEDAKEYLLTCGDHCYIDEKE